MHFGHKLITFAVGLAIAVGAQALPQVKILATGGAARLPVRLPAALR